ncbi:DUF5105 domain-containing protein [Clostridium gasigenes]|uniref:DUF5105 domain-containing protein n=1 Tax=Clostridium gasigenes TaxID=94869 RepID=UPI0014382E49|nr:DUF5105 domain-containing protein [Clostridium gasigenes]NKF06640.1 DUF5105 domain-containing protein [Clostridium gasigenes]QSW21009.1 DUF5105 domain-containing protein [Clostridium gasigenes]
MKNLKKNLIILMIIFMFPTLLVGCKTKVTSAESAKIWFDTVIKGVTSDLSSIGATEDEVSTLKDLQESTYKKELKNGFEISGLKIEDAQVDQIFKAYMDALNKVSVTTEVVSEKGESSEVKISSTYINSVALSEKAGTDAVNEFKNSTITNQEELTNKMSEVFINNLIKEFKNAVPSDSPKELTSTFIIKDKIWVPENEVEFGEAVAKLATGQE